MTIGSGLQIDFTGPCALEPVDTKEISIRTTWDPAHPLHVEANSELDEPTTQMGFKSIKMKVGMVADLSADGHTMSTSVTLKPQGVPCFAKTIAVQLKR